MRFPSVAYLLLPRSVRAVESVVSVVSIESSSRLGPGCLSDFCSRLSRVWTEWLSRRSSYPAKTRVLGQARKQGPLCYAKNTVRSVESTILSRHSTYRLVQWCRDCPLKFWELVVNFQELSNHDAVQSSGELQGREVLLLLWTSALFTCRAALGPRAILSETHHMRKTDIAPFNKYLYRDRPSAAKYSTLLLY